MHEHHDTVSIKTATNLALNSHGIKVVPSLFLSFHPTPQFPVSSVRWKGGHELRNLLAVQRSQS